MKDEDERNAYILMERINPPTTINYVVRPGKNKAEMVNCVSELGIFGFLIGDTLTGTMKEQKLPFKRPL